MSSASGVATYHSSTDHTYIGAGASDWVVAHEICHSHHHEVEWEHGHDAYYINVEWYKTEEARQDGVRVAQTSFHWPAAWLLAPNLVEDVANACGSFSSKMSAVAFVFIPEKTTIPDSVSWCAAVLRTVDRER